MIDKRILDLIREEVKNEEVNIIIDDIEKLLGEIEIIEDSMFNLYNKMLEIAPIIFFSERAQNNYYDLSVSMKKLSSIREKLNSKIRVKLFSILSLDLEIWEIRKINAILNQTQDAYVFKRSKIKGEDL